MSLEIFESRHITEFNKNAHLEAGDVTKRVPAHLLLLIFSILEPLHEILHFFPFLPPPHISRRLHSSRPDVHLLQPWISKKLGWLAHLYSMFYTLALSIWHTGECSVPGIWFTMTLLLGLRKGNNVNLVRFSFFISVYVLSTKGRASHSRRVQG